ncbi:hypothetical protein RFN28_02995 [Mesorhizobium sp. VK24D]|uniref:Uncharacterized protein n=1 Tax=Mesorhizobium album TaxID=3072314 RepID=A0ABU4XUY1_9HYPH|nr:hypothetical protein [Mesorhizobium sp. VK24D]MDX8477444.1 hypothetical protein [Mesorhizobium sp. VK24D]
MRTESIVFLWFAALGNVPTAWNVSDAGKAFESLSFLFAAFLGFAASAEAAN